VDAAEADEQIYLTSEDILEVSAAVIGATAAQAANQLRSAEALSGAVGRPPARGAVLAAAR
jgi:hypothetical protein